MVENVSVGFLRAQSQERCERAVLKQGSRRSRVAEGKARAFVSLAEKMERHGSAQQIGVKSI